ncbi:hypothetical protein D3C72_334920 [compost metagenome]
MRAKYQGNQIRGILHPELSEPAQIFFDYESSFLVDAQGRSWTKNGGGSYVLSSAQVKSGTQSVQSTASSIGSLQYEGPELVTGRSNFTYDFWFYSTNSSQSANEFIEYRRNSTDSGGILLLTRNNDLSLWNYSDSYVWSYSNFFTVNEWVRATVVRDNGVIRVYRNGVLVGTINYARDFTSNRLCLLGRYVNISSNWYTPIGFTDNMRIYPRSCRYFEDFDPNYDI